MKTWYLRTPSRIHLGLMELDPHADRAFAGLGVLLDDPGFWLRWWPESSTTRLSSVVGACQDLAWGARIEQAAKAWSNYRGRELPLGRIDVLRAPSAHAGFGSGTQLACGVTTLLEWVAKSDPAQQASSKPHESFPARDVWGKDQAPEALIETLACASQRGLRSMIGVAGFLNGGWIIDHGRSSAPRIHRFHNPHYQVLLVRVRSEQPVCGEREVALMKECAERTNVQGPEMMQLIDQQIRPSLMKPASEPQLGEHLYRYGCLAGELFRPVQGGVFRSPAIAKVVEELRSLGIAGVGQSSWGPAVFGIVDRQLAAESITRIATALNEHPLVESHWWSTVNLDGARIWAA